MEGVDGGEGVVHDVPVAVVVLGVEAHDPQRRGVGDGPRQLLGRRAGGDAPIDGGHDLGRVLAQELPRQGLHLIVVQPFGTRRAGGEQLRQPFLGLAHEPGQVVGMAPLALLLVAAGGRGLRHKGGEHAGGGVPPQQLDRLEGLVGEVDGVAAVQEDVIGRGRRHDVAENGSRQARGYGGGEGAFGGVGGPAVYEAPVPGRQPPRREAGRAQRRQREARRAPPGVPGHEGQAVNEGQGAVAGVELGQHVGHGHQHREPRAPPRSPVPAPPIHADAHDLARIGARFEQAENGLGRDQRQPLLQALLQPPSVVLHGLGPRLDHHHDVVAFELDGIGAHVVGEGVERASAL